MPKNLVFTLILLTLCSFGWSQDVTGIWRGYFYSGYGAFKQEYKYEVQLNELPGNVSQHALQGVTYSYRTTEFYGKATLSGMFDKRSKSITIKETKLVELRMAQNSQACLMTCYLDYQKLGNKEILSGTFSSVFVNSGGDCGIGSVYLEKVPTSDFKKEDFLLKKTTPPPAPKPKNQDLVNLQRALGVTPDGILGPKTLAVLKEKIPDFSGPLDISNHVQMQQLISRLKQTKPAPTVVTRPQKNELVVQLQKLLGTTPDGIMGPNTRKLLKQRLPDVTGDIDVQNEKTMKDLIARLQTKPPVNNPPVTKPVQPAPDQTVVVPKKEPPQPSKQKVAPSNIPVPKEIKERSNNLFRTLITNSPEIKIELFDNGEIDGDTITVYDNNQVIASRKGLTGKPITLSITASEMVPVHEIVMVANNLGSIPPNTAMMVVTTGGKRYEVFISSDEKQNAKVVIRYQPPGN